MKKYTVTVEDKGENNLRWNIVRPDGSTVRSFDSRAEAFDIVNEFNDMYCTESITLELKDSGACGL